MRVVQPPYYSFWIIILIVSLPTWQSAGAPTSLASCPGVTRGTCGRQCTLHVCRQLATFYKATNNILKPTAHGTKKGDGSSPAPPAASSSSLPAAFSSQPTALGSASPAAHQRS
ncbi:hypothetical protein COO60DRAFT_487893 [Scenedesmus sp. NREL 46B-D3]|nr:hypothetical protein COO60DRAFT_487893 [Scenedesmus sp. NREL 46B-D3]